MRAFRKRWMIPLAFVIVLLPTPWVFEQMVRSNLDFDDVRTRIQEAFRSHTGLELSIQGSNYSIFEGLRFRGVRVYRESATGERDYVFQCERLVLTIPVTEILSGDYRVGHILIGEGRWTPGVLETEEWWQIWERVNATQALEDQPIPYLRRDVRFTMENIRIDTPDGRLTELGQYIVLSGESYRDSDERRAECLFQLVEEQDVIATLEASGTMRESRLGRVDIELEKVPLRAIANLHTDLPFLEVPDINLAITHGVLDGVGSFDGYGPGVGAHFAGDYSHLSVRADLSQLEVLDLKDGSGHLEYHSGWMLDTEGAGYARLEVEQPGLVLDTEYTRQDLDSPPVLRVEMQVRPGEDGLALEGFGEAGSIELEMILAYDDHRAVAPELRIRLEDIEYNFADDQVFRIESGELLNRAESETYEVDARLSFLDSPIHVSGSGHLALSKATEATTNLRIQHAAEYSIEWKDLDCPRLMSFVSKRHQAFLATGSDEDSSRAEDSGPLWEVRFFESAFYRTFLEGADVKLNTRLTNLRPSILPEELWVYGRLNRDQLNLKLENYSSESTSLAFQYSVQFQHQMPHHEVQVRAELKEGGLPVHSLTGADEPPSYIKFSYEGYGNGWLAADLLHYTYTRLRLDANDIAFADPRILELLGRAGPTQGDRFLFDRLIIHRTTDGPNVTLNVAGNQNDLALRLEGEYSAGHGGGATLRFSGSSNERVRLQIRGDQTWTPVFL